MSFIHLYTIARPCCAEAQLTVIKNCEKLRRLFLLRSFFVLFFYTLRRVEMFGSDKKHLVYLHKALMFLFRFYLDKIRRKVREGHFDIEAITVVGRFSYGIAIVRLIEEEELEVGTVCSAES